MASLHAFLSPSPTLGGESSSQGTFSERLSQQSTTASSSSQSQPSQSQSQGQASAQTAPTQPKRVRLAVNGLQAVPGFSDPAIGDDDAEPTDVDAPPPPVKRKRGRPRVFDPAEVDMRRRERNRQAAASHRLTQRNQLGLLEREITQLAEKVGSLETYVLSLEKTIRDHNLALPPRFQGNRSLGPTDSISTETTETSDIAEIEEAPPPPSPEPRRTRRTLGRPSGSTANVNAMADANANLVASSNMLMPALPIEPFVFPNLAQPAPSLPQPAPVLSPRRALTRSHAYSPHTSPQYGREPPVSFLRDPADSFLPVDSTPVLASQMLQVSHSNPNMSHATPLTRRNPLHRRQQMPLPPELVAPAPQQMPQPQAPTPEALGMLEQLQAQLKIQEFLQSLAPAGVTVPAVDESMTPATDFSGGDDYDTMSLSAFFNLDALEDDPNDANFEPTSKHDSEDESEDEEDDDDEEDEEGDGEEEGEEEERPRKRVRTSPDEGTPEEEEEDLFLPIEDVPVPPVQPLDGLYAQTMESLGVSSRSELNTIVTQLFTAANAGAFSAAEMDVLRSLIKVMEEQGLGSVSSGSGSGSGGASGSGSGSGDRSGGGG